VIYILYTLANVQSLREKYCSMNDHIVLDFYTAYKFKEKRNNVGKKKRKRKRRETKENNEMS